MAGYRKNRRKGSAIAEFGPALFVFLVIIFFPMLNIIGMAASYCCGWYSNFMYTRELAVRRQQEGVGGVVANEITAQFAPAGPGSGIAAFVTNGAGGGSIVQVVPPVYNAANGGQPATVLATTRVNAVPFISVPWFGNIPGLTSAATFNITSERPREVTN